MEKLNIQPGDRFGTRTILREAERLMTSSHKWGARAFDVRCDCGAEFVQSLSNLTSSPNSYCDACRPRLFIEKGEVFGERVATKDSWIENGETRVELKCSCGNVSTMKAAQLLSSEPNSCSKCSSVSERKYIHLYPYYRHRHYQMWKSIKDRIFNEKNNRYLNYGGRGLTMHEEWVHSFGAFATWIEENLGEKPTRLHSIDRIDNDYGYHPYQGDGTIQLRWAPKKQQADNRLPFKKNWGVWKVGNVIGSLHKVCKAFKIFDANVKNLTLPKQNRDAYSIEDALRIALSKKYKTVPRIEMIEPPVN